MLITYIAKTATGSTALMRLENTRHWTGWRLGRSV